MRGTRCEKKELDLASCTLNLVTFPSGKKASIRLSSLQIAAGWLTCQAVRVLLAPSRDADQSRRAESYLVADATCTQRMKEFRAKRQSPKGTLKVWEGELTGTGLGREPIYEF